jgi:hypothetical protein
MKKLLIAICITLAFFLVSCGGNKIEQVEEKPPAFSILQSQTTLKKHCELGENASFSETELNEFLGESTTYITVTTLPEAENGTLMFNGSAVIKGQSIPTVQLEYLKFIPSFECKNASFGFTCDGKGFSGAEFGCELVFGDEVNSPPVAKDSQLSTVSGFTCEGKLAISEPNGDDYTINVITYPTDGFISFSEDGKITYTPKDGFSGKDSMVFTVSDCFGAVSSKATLSIEVDKNESGMRFADMQDDMAHLYAYKMCKNNVMVYRYEDGNYYFDPETPVSKMDFLVMMMCATGADADIVAVADSAVTDDNGLSSGLKGYLSAAAEQGLITLDNGRFSPKDAITLSDAAYTVSKILSLPEAGSQNVSAETGKNYKALYSAMKAGLIELADPEKTLSKSEMAELLCKVCDYMEENNMN